MSDSGERVDGPAPQPTLTDGDVSLRPWRTDDVEAARLQHDEEMAHWFGFDAVVPSGEHHRRWVEESLAQYRDDRRVVVFAVEHGGEIAGSVDVKQRGDGVGDLSWAVYPAHRGQGVASRAVRMLIDYCFGQLGLVRVQAAVEVGNLASLRTAGRAGLRREGVARGAATIGPRRPDLITLARLNTDPPPTSPEGFRGVLNAVLPLKRVISQGLIRNDAGEVLLCELTYKREWDLPGGVVDPYESPADAVIREIREELGLNLSTLGLRLVNWLPPWHGWDDAVLLVFDLGVHPKALSDAMVLQAREIRATHWCAPEAAARQVAPYLAELLPYLLGPAEGTSYLEGGVPLPPR